MEAVLGDGAGKEVQDLGTEFFMLYLIYQRFILCFVSDAV